MEAEVEKYSRSENNNLIVTNNHIQLNIIVNNKKNAMGV